MKLLLRAYDDPAEEAEEMAEALQRLFWADGPDTEHDSSTLAKAANILKEYGYGPTQEGEEPTKLCESCQYQGSKLVNVINLLLEVIPVSEAGLRSDLIDVRESALYAPPECMLIQCWKRAANCIHDRVSCAPKELWHSRAAAIFTGTPIIATQQKEHCPPVKTEETKLSCDNCQYQGSTYERL